MPRHFVFKSAALTDESGRKVVLDRVDAEFSGASRRPLRLKISSRTKTRDKGARQNVATVTTIEMSQREAFAFSEWLDAVATDPKGAGL
jgi:hypothetical protein